MLDGNEYVAFVQDAIWNTANAQVLPILPPCLNCCLTHLK
jgi:hypothetical protein